MNNKKKIFGLLLLVGLGFGGFQLLKNKKEIIVAPTTKEELGEKLFFDNLLSLDTTVSCGSCHKQEFAFADNLKFSVGVRGQLGDRNAPSSMNMAMRSHFFFDGRAATLEEQVLQPIVNPVEMDLSIKEAINRLRNTEYNNWFKELYGSPVDSALLGEALAAFILTLESPGTSAFDKWMAGDTLAMTANEINGRVLFIGKAKCFDCHFSPDFTADEFKNIGLFNGSDTLNDVGRFAITKDSADLGKMKVSGLRNIAMTPPYMHNGMFNTLAEVVEYYDDPTQFVQDPINIDTLLQKPLNLSTQEKSDIVAFLETLTDEEFLKKD